MNRRSREIDVEIESARRRKEEEGQKKGQEQQAVELALISSFAWGG